MVFLILLAFVVIVFTVDAVVRFSRKVESKASAKSTVSSRVFNETSVSIPKGIYFDKTHTWAFMEKSGVVKIGVDDFLLHITGPLNRVSMKNPGEKIRKGEPALTIMQNGKQLTISSPISGTVKSRNIELIVDSSAINNSPFQDGWIYTVEPSNWVRELQFMIMADTYKEWLKKEFSRLKDFLATNRQIHNTALAPIVLQDGGELMDNTLEEFGPEVWEEFQTRFINNSNCHYKIDRKLAKKKSIRPSENIDDENYQ